MTGKEEQIQRVRQYILDELNGMTTPLEFLVEKELAKEGISNGASAYRLERAGVLWNLNKILDNYDELEPVIKKFFSQKAREKKWGEER